MRVPLNDDGLIDADTFALNPDWATCSRYWATDPDQHWPVEREDGRWLVRCRPNDELISFHIPEIPLLLGAQVDILGTDGSLNIFVITNISARLPSTRKVG
ncbi:hypothetical protein G7076_02285 [Sphingomonas sp. HDW15A]|uniref:hypothetical protein n=1 Tax=Sphingomonas sp. HDW15A TaxID=2714942 RepID=UPI00140E2ABB|nr:hypothetical protein [Sphingomonas sp. HDW15A]QIK95470.1 hypothetical protein G7076_02285 [Sphingomonas sp. HDW15A]